MSNFEGKVKMLPFEKPFSTHIYEELSNQDLNGWVQKKHGKKEIKRKKEKEKGKWGGKRESRASHVAIFT